MAGMVEASCLPKADNTSMAGGRGLLQWYQSQGPDPRCQRGRWAPERGWMKVSHIGSWGERTTPYKREDTSIHRDAFWGQNREARDGGSVPPAQSGQYLDDWWSWAITVASEPWTRPDVPARTLGGYPTSGV